MHSLAVTESRIVHSRLVCKLRAIRCLVCIFVLHQLKFDFDPPGPILVAVTNPQCSHGLPIRIPLHNREPRSCHEVDPLESQAGPEMIQAHTFHRATCHQRLQFLVLHLEDMSAIERHPHVGEF